VTNPLSSTELGLWAGELPLVATWQQPVPDPALPPGIVYLGTVESQRPLEGMIALGTAKAAPSSFARYVAEELGPRGITHPAKEPRDRLARSGHDVCRGRHHLSRRR
jgi:NAD(P)-dependent dehydrogenase (short-subunit alcohol dehydrogenase family)